MTKIRYGFLSILLLAGVCFAADEVDVVPTSQNISAEKVSTKNVEQAVEKGTGLNVQDVKAVVQESELATQTIVQDSKGGQIKILTTIRDTSWPPSVSYDPYSYYELVPSLFHDKISIREVKLTKLDRFYQILCPIIKRQWNPSSGPVTLWHFDLLDALTIGAQDGNTPIVKAALDKMPYTKSILSSGKTTDFMSGEPLIIDGKFKIDLFIELACDSMETRINKYRTLKFAAPLYAGLSVAALEKTSQLFGKFFDQTVQKEHTNIEKGSIEELDTFSFIPTHKVLTAGLALTVSAMAGHLENLYIRGYIQTLNLLVSSDRVVFDHTVAYEKIKNLKNKLQWFGISTPRIQAMERILSKI